MKYIKTFESFSINEEGSIRKFFTGHESKEDKAKAEENFHKALAEAEEVVNKNPKAYVFNKAKLEEAAKENSYRGGIAMRKSQGGQHKGLIFVVYDPKATGFEELAAAAGGGIGGSVGGSAYGGK